VIQRIASVLIGGVALTTLGFLMWWFIAAPDIHLFWKIIMVIVILGIFILLVLEGWERYRAYKGKEKEFREVE
jgi:uncharacterized membrane-anchored protein